MLLFSEPDQSIVRATIVAPSLDFNVMPVHAFADWVSAMHVAIVVKNNKCFMFVFPL